MKFSEITIGIVTFRSENVIFKCLKSIKKIKKIIILDYLNDNNLKKKIIKKYPRIKIILSKKNLGYGVGNNKIVNISKTPYVFILNPDTILKNDCENQLLKSLNKVKKNFAILAPLEKNNNFGFFKKSYNSNKYMNNEFKVDFVKGFALLLNKNKFKKIGMFDKNYFLYLEEIDLCRRFILDNQSIFVSKKSKIFHLGAKSSNIGLEFEKCRNWHWMWSNVYYNKKFSSYILTFLKFSLKLFNELIKFFIYSLFLKKNKKIIFKMRFLGILNALLGKKSYYRPKLIN